MISVNAPSDVLPVRLRKRAFPAWFPENARERSPAHATPKFPGEPRIASVIAENPDQHFSSRRESGNITINRSFGNDSHSVGIRMPFA